MKKCPNCQKEFPDTMRFCQTDGTPLIEESQPEDPLKTTVVRQEDIASAIPPADPFKTMVAGSSNREDSGDLLQLPEEEEFDPLKTMVAAPIGQNKPILEDPKPEPPKFEEIKEEIKSESSPFSGFSQPSEPLPEAPKDYSADPTLFQPEPPKFNEPSLNPPSFSDSSSKEENDLPQTMMQNSWDNAPKSEQSPYSNDSPFSKPNDAPMASPFDKPFDTPKPFEEQKSSFEQPPSSFNEPPSPFGNQPSSPFNQQFDAPKESSFDQPPQASFENQPASFEPQTPMFQEPSNQFDQANQGFGTNQPLQQNEWNPPPSPEQGWGDQGLGANTPFQPPVVGAGKSQGLAIASIVCGGISLLSLVGLVIPFVNFLCFFGSPALGLAGIITGFLARSRANRDPEQYGGGGLALGGIITGALSILATIGLILVTVVWFGYLASR